MKRILLGLNLLLATSLCAQPLKTLNNVRLYEHHSSMMNNGSPFGGGANGKKSGYNFMENRYFSSIDSIKGGAWKGNEAQHIDMVEHKGPFGGPPGRPPFGFTAGASSIWGGKDIKGNGLTKYMEVPATFYDTVTDVACIQGTYKSAQASVEVAEAIAGKAYVAQIRNTNRYVVLKITNVKNIGNTKTGDTASVYFDFNYKYGDYVKPNPAGINDIENNAALTLSPNPAHSYIRLQCNTAGKADVRIFSHTGQQVQVLRQQTIKDGLNIHITGLPAGTYYTTVTCSEGTYTKAFVKE